jgi:hypothetical protein
VDGARIERLEVEFLEDGEREPAPVESA